MAARVGFLGIGRMGAPMARCLVQAGHHVVVFDSRPDREQVAAEIGATSSPEVEVATRSADAVISMLPDAASTIELARRGLPAMKPGSTWIDMGSNPPDTAAALVELAAPHDVDVLEAPVGGGPDTAADGLLQLFVGGEHEVFLMRQDVMHAMADPTRISYLGEHGRGYTAKLLVNLLWFGQAVATGEALLLAAHAGIDLDAMYSALTHSAVAGRFVERDLAALLRGDYLTTFGLAASYAELAAIRTVAEQAGTPFTVSNQVIDTYRQALAELGPIDGELQAVALLERRAGITLRSRKSPSLPS